MFTTNGRAIAYIRKSQAMTITEASKRAGVSVSSWYQYEQGNCQPPTLMICATALGVSVQDILKCQETENFDTPLAPANRR